MVVQNESERLVIIFDDCGNKFQVLQVINLQRCLITDIRTKQLLLFGHIMRKEYLEKVVTVWKNEVIRVRGHKKVNTE